MLEPKFETNSLMGDSFLDQFGIINEECPKEENNQQILHIPAAKVNLFNLTEQQELALRLSHFLLACGIFGTCTFFEVKESLSSLNIKVLTTCAIFHGLSVASLCHLLFPEREIKGAQKNSIRKFLNRLTNRCALEAIWAGSQAFLIYAGDNAKQRKICGLPFVYVYSKLKGKDISAISLLDGDDLFLSAISTENPIRTLSYPTKDFSRWAKVAFAAWGATALGLIILNFTLHQEYKRAGVLGEFGLIQDSFSLVSGNITGSHLTKLMCYYKEILEKKHRRGENESFDSKALVKILRVAQATLVIVPVMLVANILAIPTMPNTSPDFWKGYAVGALHGSSLLITREGFEKGIGLPDELPDDACNCCCPPFTWEKVQRFASSYLPNIAFFALMVIWMGYVAFKFPPVIQGSIAVFLIFIIISFIATDRTIVHCNPREDGPSLNEWYFRVVYAFIALSIYFQFLTMKVQIQDRNINNNSPWTKTALQYFMWALYGMIFGNNAAIHLHGRAWLPTIPPVIEQELVKRVIQNYN